jgi:trehalose/maltose hydrolase-like predicted phosphorylase
MKKHSTWTVLYRRFEPAQEALREALCTLGNGYFATRGAIPESCASKIHYPGTYIAGVYNKLPTFIAGRVVYNEDFVNCPNWLFLTFKIEDGEWFCPSTARILYFHQELDMYQGILKRRIRFQDSKGRITSVETTRLVHMEFPHLGALEYIITPQNWQGKVTVRSILDGAVQNTGVERYRQLNSKHLEPYALGNVFKNHIYLAMRTNQSKIIVSYAASLKIFNKSREITPAVKTITRRLMEGAQRIGQEFRFFAQKKESYRIEKVVSIYTSKDEGIKDPTKSAIDSTKKAPGFRKLLVTHKLAWERLWKKFDLQIEGDIFSQWTLRFHIFHLLQVASPHTIKIDTGLPARGLHGEAYRGHVFWDEIFVLHFYDYHLPQISKALLLYRYRRLGKARIYARKAGLRGAMFPWQSGSTGEEETQVIHLNPLSGKWDPDYSRYQRHISFAIAYNVWQYWARTNDFDFLVKFGAELILSIAQFGASLAKYDSRDGRYHTEGIMGPDEFHEKYPGALKPGVKDNAYTNFLIVWTLLKAKETLSILPPASKRKLLKKLKLDERELGLWDDITRKMKIVINRKGIISQFDGYFKLKELDWSEYRGEYGNIQRMDRILKAEEKSPDEYKVTKQADALMIFYLFPLSEIKRIFGRLGYNFSKDMLKNNYEYYMKRTSHGSTLSKVVHCFIAHKLKKMKEAWWWFSDVLESDIYDTQRGTTPEGIHVGVMGGSLDIAVRGFIGLQVLNDRIKIDPNLPKNWHKVKFKFLCRRVWFSLVVAKNEILIRSDGRKKPEPPPVEIKGKLYRLPYKKTLRVLLKTT